MAATRLVRASPRTRSCGVIFAWAVVVVLWVGFLATAFIANTTHADGSLDFRAYDQAARAYLSGGDMYSKAISQVYLYPPFLAVMLSPLTRLGDLSMTGHIWFFINLVLLLSTLTLMSRTMTTFTSRLLVWLLPIFFTPSLQTLWHGQVTILLLALTAGAWWARRTDRPGLTGALLVTAAWIKIYPALFLVYFFWRHDWRVLRSALVVGVALGLFQLIVAGPQLIDYFTDTLPNLAAVGEIGITHSNESILGFSSMLFRAAVHVEPMVESPMLFVATRLGITALVLAVTAFALYPPMSIEQIPASRFNLEYCLTLLVAMLLGGTLNPATLISALFVFLILVDEGHNPEETKSRTALLCLLAYSLITVHLFIILGYIFVTPDNTLPGPFLALPFYGMMIIWLRVVVLIHKHSPSAVSRTIAPSMAAEG
jgi:hypothetical protein